jgi:hypothetical protein
MNPDAPDRVKVSCDRKGGSDGWRAIDEDRPLDPL